MKKSLVILPLAALVFALPATAHEGRMFGQARAELKSENRVGTDLFANLGSQIRINDNRFMLKGTVTVVGSNNLTISTSDGSKVILVNSETKFRISGQGQGSLADISVNDRVMANGTVANGNLNAAMVAVISPKKVAMGTVTAKTDNLLTIQNNLTGSAKTVLVNPETEVRINGDAQTFADVQVGDRGMVKFKAVLDTFVATMIRLFR